MSGLCGWFDATSTRSDEASSEIAEQMHRHFGASGPRSMQPYSGGLVCATGPESYADLDSEMGVAAAIAGNPRWIDSNDKSVATEFGDARALIKAYATHGSSVAARILGPFSFALVDYRRNRTLLAIDRMGIRPLCYSVIAAGEVVFGSTATSVRGHPAVRAPICNESLYRYFYFHVIPSPATIFDGILKLEPAQTAIFEGGSVRKEFYWRPRHQPEYASGAGELFAELKTRTRSAVARSAPDDDTACFLSGGLDSSTISGLANEMTERPIRAYTIGFDQRGFDETSFARKAARHFGLKHVEHYVTPADVANAFDQLCAAYDEPFGNSSMVPAFFCARKAREDGVARLLAGDGGDELFAGNERYATQKLFQHYHGIPRLLRKYMIEPTFGLLRIDRPTLLRKARRYVEQARLPMPDRLQTYNFLEVFAPSRVFQQQFLDSVDRDTPLREMREWYERSNDFDFLDRMLIFDWKLTLADNDIRKVNRMCEVAGVAVDYPLLDDDLVEFSLKIPPKMKLRGSNLRFAFKQAHRDYLPRAILEKSKHGFGLPFGEWLNTSNELREKILPNIERFRHRNVLNNVFIDEMLDRHRMDHAGYYGNMLWLIAVLENWLSRNDR